MNVLESIFRTTTALTCAISFAECSSKDNDTDPPFNDPQLTVSITEDNIDGFLRAAVRATNITRLAKDVARIQVLAGKLLAGQ